MSVKLDVVLDVTNALQRKAVTVISKIGVSKQYPGKRQRYTDASEHTIK